MKLYRHKIKDILKIPKSTWKHHYENVFALSYNNESSPVEIENNNASDSLDNDFFLYEVHKAAINLKNKKAPGLDKIPNEIWKSMPQNVLNFVTNLFNKCSSEGKVPRIWCDAAISPIYKKEINKIHQTTDQSALSRPS